MTRRRFGRPCRDIGECRWPLDHRVVDVPDEGGTLPMLASPADFGGVVPRPRWRAPRLGEHTEVVLGELGLDDRDIARLVEAGVAGTGVAGTDRNRGAE